MVKYGNTNMSSIVKEGEEQESGEKIDEKHRIMSPNKIDKIDKREKQEKLERNSTKNTNRCVFCNKKIGLFGIKCKCDGLFCSIHRYAESHNCPFDYKGYSKEGLFKTNPLIIPQKIDQI